MGGKEGGGGGGGDTRNTCAASGNSPYVRWQEGLLCLPAQSQEHGGELESTRSYTRRAAPGRTLNALLPVMSSSMTGLVLGQWWSGEVYPWKVRRPCHSHNALTAVRYRNVTLRAIVRPSAGAAGPGFLLVLDNARPHVAGVCSHFLKDEDIDDIDWLKRSPDLNPNDHLWNVMYCESTEALIMVWEEFPQDTIRRLIRSTSRCYWVHTGTWRPYTLIHFMSCCGEINASCISLCFQFFYLDFRCGFESIPETLAFLVYKHENKLSTY